MEDLIKKQIGNLKEEGERIEKEIRQKVVGYILAGLGVVAGLAWNDAIKAAIEYFFPTRRNTVTMKFAYAFLITMIVAFMSVYLVRIFKKKDK